MKLLLTTAVAATLASPVSQLTVEGKTVDAFEPPVLSICHFNRILPDPSSRRVVVWRAERDLRARISSNLPSEFIVADFPGVGSEDETMHRVSFVGGLFRVEPLRWNESGDRLLFRAGDNGAGLFDPATHTLARAPDLDPLWILVRIATISHGGTDFYRNAATLDLLRRIDRDGTSLRAMATIDRTSASFLVFRLGNAFDLTGYAGARRWDTGVRISDASAPLLLPGADRPAFMGDQTGFATFLPYAMPLVDLSAGRIAGRFGWERIEPTGGPAIDLAPVFHRQLMTIEEAAANGGTIVALVDLEREMRVVRIRGGEVRSWRLCEKRGLQFGTHVFPAMNALPAETPVVRTEIRFSSNTDPARPGPFGQIFRPLNADGRLIVYFHGGPTATLAEETVPQNVSNFAPHGISVLDVEYSGMLGGGLALTDRLPRLGLRAIRQDVDAVTRWVRRSGFRHVYLLADSFGGAPAVIAAVEHPNDYAHFFLRAPFLALRNPEQSVHRGQLLDPDPRPDSQREFEEVVYGGGSARGRLGLGAELQAFVRRLRPSPRVSFYFGGIDPVSAASDLPASFAGDRSVMIVPRTAHENLAATPEVMRDILAKLESSR